MDERKNRSRKEEGSELEVEKERESKKRSYRDREGREKKERDRESRRRSGREKSVEEDDGKEVRVKKERDRDYRRRSGRENSVEEDDDKVGREKKERDRDSRRRPGREKSVEEDDDDKEGREKKEHDRDSRRRSGSEKNVEEDDGKVGREKKQRDRDYRRRSGREKSVEEDDDKEGRVKKERDRENRLRSGREKSVEEDDDKEGREKKERDREIRRRSGREKNVEKDDDDEYRERGSRRRSERERSLDVDYKHKEKESGRRSDKEKSVVLDDDDKHKKRESRRRADKDMSSNSDDKHKKRESRPRTDRELSSDSDDKHKKRESRRRSEREMSSDSDEDKHKKRESKRRSDRERSLDIDYKLKEKESRKRSEKERSTDVYDDDKHKQRESRRLSDREQSSDSDDKHKKRDSRHHFDKESHRDRKRRRKGDELKDRDHESERGSSKSVKQKEDGEDTALEKKNELQFPDNKEKNREEDLAEEQKRLDDEMEKRRRRVQEWQELKRKKEEAEQEKLGVVASSDEAKSGKNWTLEGESDDEEGDPEGNTDMDVDAASNGDHKLNDVDQDGISVDSVNGTIVPTPLNEPDDEEVDPLDAYMNSMVLPEVEKLSSVPLVLDDMIVDSPEDKTTKKGASTRAMGRIIPGEDSDSDYEDVEDEEDPVEDEDDEEFMKRVKKTKVDKLTIVDHSKIDYPAFRKNFYIEVKEIARMTPDEVSSYRKQLELKIHGKDVPKPVKTWHQTGLSTKILDTIRKLNFEKPTQIQAQALPIIMSGRDCIGIAKTGSGKTLAFVLPMLRHIKDQPPLMPGDGPVGLIMAPTRELVQQIHSDIKKFAKVVGLSCVPVYGGSGVAQQISDLKRGTEIVVCTPGRMIDILCTSSGKITNLRRVTYLVLDEADRMFDMGFEPQITRIVQNTRPDRQTVLFSATFPRQVEILARKVLDRPIEIQVGGRSVVNKDISQTVEVRPESERFLRLLEILGEWYEKGKILIFVHSQEKCDALFRDLLKHGYPCLSLHGAKDQTDRESTLADFKSNVCNLLIATSVAARGLDVKELELVLNYDVTNHYEDYVHRVGRTGRAGRKGCAITFISEEEERYAPDLVKALELSEQVVPGDLKALADGFMAKVNQGIEQAHGTGYGGSGFKFNEEEDEARKAAKKAQAKEYGFEEDKSDSEDEDDGVRKSGGLAVPTPVQGAQNGALPAQVPNVSGMPIISIPAVVQATSLPGPVDAAARAQAIAAAMNLHQNLAKIQATAMPEHYEAELEINDFPQNARWKVTHKETLGPISEWTGAAITTRGQYIPPGKILGQNERKLYLFIEGPTEQSVKQAKSQLKRVLEDISMQATSLPGSAQPGRYQVL
ncbi:RNA helicase [Lithospermum erythrorhizon]|uniref:RNA helicase n=1 Tax=Lithospermum erythrorhizon TaxID=34254 RepID=A0AAV3Q047_LITER